MTLEQANQVLDAARDGSANLDESIITAALRVTGDLPAIEFKSFTDEWHALRAAEVNA